MKMRVLLLLSTLTFFAACAQERIVERPVPVPGPTVYEYVDVPSDLLIQHQKTTIPDDITWGEGAILWAADRATIDILLGQIRAIESLNDGTDSNN
jgi:hypothetical protein